jgi:uncharacterized membrane protein YtjA (UPF0391 family)
MVEVIEIQNRINIRNIIIFFILGIVGAANGFRDFSIYKLDISKILFPDPVIFHEVVELNNSQMNVMVANSSMSFIGSAGILLIFIFAVVFVISISAGVLGRGD